MKRIFIIVFGLLVSYNLIAEEDESILTFSNITYTSTRIIHAPVIAYSMYSAAFEMDLSWQDRENSYSDFTNFTLSMLPCLQFASNVPAVMSYFPMTTMEKKRNLRFQQLGLGVTAISYLSLPLYERTFNDYSDGDFNRMIGVHFASLALNTAISFVVESLLH